jgi:hypothetical protein
MKNKYIFPILILLCLCGCNKSFLERTPEDKLTATDFYQTDEEVYAATAPLYNVPWTGYNNKCGYALGDARGGNLKSNDRNSYYKFTVQASYDEVRDAWRSLYNIIANCNMTIYNLKTYSGSKVSDQAKKHGIAEAKFMRAIAFAHLTMLWKNVPIIYNNIVQMTDTSILPNRPEDIWEFAIRDMRFAVKNLPDKPISTGRICKYTAEGYLAKLFLYRAGLNSTNGLRNQTDLDSAKYYAADVCHNSSYSLMTNYYDLFLWKNDNNVESMFALQWETANDKDWTGVKNQLQAFLAYEPAITGAGDGWGGALGPSANMINYYLNIEPNDIRRKATFMFNLDTFTDLRSDEVLKNGTKGYVFTGTSAIKKYVVGSTADNPEPVYLMGTGNNTYMLRLAEIYLVYAEAILGDQDSTTDAEALKYFNAIRTRAGLSSVTSIRLGLDTFTTNKSQGKIIMEKRAELCMEGNTWYDLIRLYYYKPQDVITYISMQNLDESYTLAIDTTHSTKSTKKYDFTTASVSYTPTDAVMYLPIPEIEAAQAHNLKKDPVPFDFTLYE